MAMTDQLTPCCVIYAAKSTSDPKGSIGTQLKDGRALAMSRNYTVAGEYEDESASAYHGDRGPGLARAMAHCESIAPCALVIQHSDRLARGNVTDAKHLVEYTIWALKTGVQIVSKQDAEMFPEGEFGVLMERSAGCATIKTRSARLRRPLTAWVARALVVTRAGCSGASSRTATCACVTSTRAAV